jgi:hypothetical protein
MEQERKKRASAAERQRSCRDRKRTKQATEHRREALLKDQKEEEAAAEAEAAAVDEEPLNPVTLNVFSFARQVSPLCHQEGGV